MIDAMMSGRGAKATVYVWGSWRGRRHIYAKHVYSADVSMTNHLTLCGKVQSPKGNKTEEAAPLAGACVACVIAWTRKQATETVSTST